MTEPRRAVITFDLRVPPLPPPPAFLAAAQELGVEFAESDLDQLGRYLAMVLRGNEAVNLTAVRDPDEAWTRHILDALTLLPVLNELPTGASVLDVGSGAGLPGLPLAICMPELRFVLLEATGKKAAFLCAAIDALGLRNAEVLQGRAEALGAMGSTHRDAFDAVVARAVGRLAVVAELAVPFAKVGAPVLLIKGQAADEELEEAKAALHLLHAGHAGTIGTPTGRIVVLDKLRPTPRIYPRRDGEPKRRPLGAE